MNEPGEVKTDLFFLVGKNALLQMEYWNRTQHITNCPYFSDEFGLHLVLGRVEEESYAHQCGLREGDIIVYVNGWLITVMDKPQVGRDNIRKETKLNV